MIIAIDGTSGVGKGTLAKAIAAHFHIPYLDTGLLYRAVGRKMLDAGLLPDSGQVIEFAKQLQEKDWQRSDLRTPEVDQAASQVAAIPQVRAALLAVQREFAMQQGGVMDGRDIGTVIFPSADVKLFLTASSRVRAERRWLQYTSDPKAADKEAQIARIEAELQARDERDASRAVAPLKPAEDAILIATDHRSAAEILQQAIEIIENHKIENHKAG